MVDLRQEEIQLLPVQLGEGGQLRTVHYHLINALLLNEVQKQHRTIESHLMIG